MKRESIKRKIAYIIFMMAFIGNLFTFLAVILLFDENMAAVFKRLNVNIDNIPENYARLRNQNIHRGLLFSFSVSSRKEICKDILSSQFYQDLNTAFSGDDNNDSWWRNMASQHFTENKPNYSIVLRKLTSINKQLVSNEEIFFECIAKLEIENRELVPVVLYISYAFEADAFHTNLRNERNTDHLELKHYFTLSPEYVPLDQLQLEENYVNMRRTLRALNEESFEWLRQVEIFDDISVLSRSEKMLLCASILGAPVYQQDNIVFHVNWSDITGDPMIIQRHPLYFQNEEYKNENFFSDNVECKAVRGDLREPFTVYITKSYNNENSAYVLKKSEGGIEIDKYFRNIAILINAEKKSTARNLAESSHVIV